MKHPCPEQTDGTLAWQGHLCSCTGQNGGGGEIFKLGTVKQEQMVNVAVDNSNIVVCPEGLWDLVSKHVISKIKFWEGVGLAELVQLQVRIKIPRARAVPWCCVWLWAVIAAVIIPNQLKPSRTGNF